MDDPPTVNLPVVARDKVQVPGRPPALGLRRLTFKQEAFARRYASHGNVTQAYREAFDTRNMLLNTVHRKASLERHKPHVAERIRQLMAAAAEHITISAKARMVRLQMIAEADPAEIVRIVIEPCPACWPSAASPTEPPAPDHTTPRADCQRCHGEGARRVVLTPSDEWSHSARALVRSVRQRANGEIEIRFHNQLEAADMLNRAQGLYVERSMSVTAHVAVPPVQEWTREQQLAFLESLKPVAG